MKNKIFKNPVVEKGIEHLFHSISELIEKSKQRTAYFINSELILLYWNVGKLIRKNILKSKRAEYGEQIIQTHSQDVTAHFGSGWSKRQLWNWNLCVLRV